MTKAEGRGGRRGWAEKASVSGEGLMDHPHVSARFAPPFGRCWNRSGFCQTESGGQAAVELHELPPQACLDHVRRSPVFPNPTVYSDSN